MASRFETFSEDEICVINEAVVQTNTKKPTNFSSIGGTGYSGFFGGNLIKVGGIN